jgi:hypothetical protein
MTYYYYKDKKGEWRWRLKAANQPKRGVRLAILRFKVDSEIKR